MGSFFAWAVRTRRRRSERMDARPKMNSLSARLRLPGVKRNGRGHRRAKRRPPRLPPLCLFGYATTSPTELPDYLPYTSPIFGNRRIPVLV